MTTRPAGRTVIVIGHNRGGTSMIAGILHNIGVRMGPIHSPPEWVDRQWATPTGHYENRDFASLNGMILDPSGRWRLRANPRWLRDRECPPTMVEAMKATIRRNEGGLWGWKDNLTVFLVDQYIPLVADPHLLFVTRDPAAVANSLHRRDGANLAEARRAMDIYSARIMETREKFRALPTLFVSYETTLRSPAETIRAIVKFLGLSPTLAQLEAAKALVLDPKTLRTRVRQMARARLALGPTMLWALFRRIVAGDPELKLSREVRTRLTTEAEETAGLLRVRYIALNGVREILATFRAAL